MKGEDRLKVLWFGERPEDSCFDEFSNRNLTLELSDITKWERCLYESRGIVIKLNSSKINHYYNTLSFLYPKAVDNGIKLYAIYDDDSLLSVMSEGKERVNIEDQHIVIQCKPKYYDIAEVMARYNPGPSPNSNLKIIPNDLDIKSEVVKISKSTEHLLKRAFRDCKTILITPLKKGRSDAEIFSVNAVFDNSMVGPRPLPFFVKIDEPNKINQEIENYRLYTNYFIQFNLRPNLDSNRCLNGAKKGILVGNFVELSETLWDVATRGHAQAAIYALFEITLRGWRLQIHEVTANFAEKMNDHFFSRWEVPPDRFEIAKSKGATIAPVDLKKILFKLPKYKFKCSPMHGDLNALNVIIRGGDAILIDFFSARSGPLAADPAALEVSLAFEVNGDKDDNETWEKLVNILYTDYLIKPPPPAIEPRQREWLWSCIRQIRLMAFAELESEFEYKIALAAYLLRRAGYPSIDDKDNYRKAYAYVLAERIICDTKQKLEA